MSLYNIFILSSSVHDVDIDWTPRLKRNACLLYFGGFFFSKITRIYLSESTVRIVLRIWRQDCVGHSRTRTKTKKVEPLYTVKTNVRKIKKTVPFHTIRLIAAFDRITTWSEATGRYCFRVDSGGVLFSGVLRPLRNYGRKKSAPKRSQITSAV